VLTERTTVRTVHRQAEDRPVGAAPQSA